MKVCRREEEEEEEETPAKKTYIKEEMHGGLDRPALSSLFCRSLLPITTRVRQIGERDLGYRTRVRYDCLALFALLQYERNPNGRRMGNDKERLA